MSKTNDTVLAGETLLNGTYYNLKLSPFLLQ